MAFPFLGLISSTISFSKLAGGPASSLRRGGIVRGMPSVRYFLAFLSTAVVGARMQSDTAGAAQDRGRTVEELERELAEAHRREAATAEVLRVISRSLTEAKPVFDIIAASALQLVRAQYVRWSYDGELQHLVALDDSNPDVVEAIRRAFPRRLDDRYSTGRAILSRRPFRSLTCSRTRPMSSRASSKS